MYPLSQGQQPALDEFLKKHLKKGYICWSKFPYALPFFFIKKKFGGLERPTQDYHQLNAITICNTYLLPPIKELINWLLNKEWFTKFDIQWEYNSICIKEGNKWKAAFKTNRELFKPTVMFFGLTNSPATLQTIMDELFKEELATGNVVIYMDDILIAIAGTLDAYK